MFTLFVIGAIWFVYQIRDIVFVFFISLLIMVVLNPIVKKLSRLKVPRAISVLVVYLLFFALIIVSLAGILPPLVEQTGNFASHFPTYIKNINIPSAINDQISSQVLLRVGDLPSVVVGFGVGLISNFLTLLTVLTFAFYLLMARNKLEHTLTEFLGEKKANMVEGFLDELEIKISGWVRGEFILMFTVGVFNYIGLTLLNIPFALPIAIFAGLLEIVPYVGPIFGAVPGLLIGFGISPVMGLATAALAFLVQQVENYVLAPKIMEKSVGVSPVVTLLSLAIGFKIAGIVGVLISIPIVIMLQVLAKRHFLIQ